MISYAHPLISGHAGTRERFLQLPHAYPGHRINYCTSLDPCWHVVFYPAAQEGGSIFETEGDQLKLKGVIFDLIVIQASTIASIALVIQVVHLLLQQLLRLLAASPGRLVADNPQIIC